MTGWVEWAGVGISLPQSRCHIFLPVHTVHGSMKAYFCRKHHYNKANASYDIPAELFQILKDDAIKVLYSICQQIWKTKQWPQDWKRSTFIPIPKKSNAKECSNYCTLVLISHATEVMLKSFKLGFNSMWTKNFQMYKLDLEKAEEPDIKLPTLTGL